MPFAGVAELVDARDLGSRDESRGGSNPSARTTPRKAHRRLEALSREHRRARAAARHVDCRHASDRNPHRRPQARIPGRGPGRRSRGAGRTSGSTSSRTRCSFNGFRPGKVPVAHLKQVYGRVGDGRDHRGGRSARPTPRSSTDRGFKLAMRAARSPCRTEEAEVEKVIDGQVRSRLHGGARGPADDRARRFQGHQARAARRRGDRRRGRRGARAGSPSRTGRSPPRARAPRSRAATASSSTSPARSTARRSRAAPAATSASMSARAPSSRASRTSSSAWRRARRARSRSPSRTTYPTAAARRQGRRVRGDREVDRGAGHGHDRRRIRQVARPGVARQAQGGGQGAARARARRR